MVEKVPFGENKKIEQEKPQNIISTSPSDITVLFRGPEGDEHEAIYSDSTTSDVIALNTADKINASPTQEYQDAFIEQLDKVRANPYWQETHLEFKAIELKWPPSLGSLKVTIKKGLREIVSYKKSSEKTNE